MRLVLFAILLAVIGGVAALIGAASGGGHATVARSGGMEMHREAAAPSAASGLASSAGGYTFEPARTTFGVGANAFRFRIVDAQGNAAHDFDLDGGVRLHLIVVRRDLVGYTHVHPRLQPDGSWLVPLSFREPGVYRAFADFELGGRKTVLGRDLFVAGPMKPQPLPQAARTQAVGGYSVELSPHALRAGQASDLSFAVTRNGAPVESFEPYVGARGHLLALHDGDLAYSHVHPVDGSAPGRIEFHAELAAPGEYRLFLQFKLGGRVFTAPFTVEVQR